MFNFEHVRDAEVILIDKDIYEKLIPVDWEQLEDWLNNERKL